VRRKNDFIKKIITAVPFAFIFYILIVISGVSLGVQGEMLVFGSLFASLLFAVFIWKTPFSLIGLISFFIVLCTGTFAKLTPEQTLLFSVVSCLATAFFITIAKAFHD